MKKSGFSPFRISSSSFRTHHQMTASSSSLAAELLLGQEKKESTFAVDVTIPSSPQVASDPPRPYRAPSNIAYVVVSLF